jgi:putative toxin-antitoxin system antitoxin component (TIGR02293 family)
MVPAIETTALVVKAARKVFGNSDSAYSWLKEANQALGGKCPLDVLSADGGADRVIAILGRIEHGIFS